MTKLYVFVKDFDRDGITAGTKIRFSAIPKYLEGYVEEVLEAGVQSSEVIKESVAQPAEIKPAPTKVTKEQTHAAKNPAKTKKVSKDKKKK